MSIPTSLDGTFVRLLPMTREHFPVLQKLAEDKRIWQFYNFDGSCKEKFLKHLEQSLIEKELGTQIPFVIYHIDHDKIIGSTRYMDIQRAHKKLEIGTTWLHPHYWATVINPECKLLLLHHAFEKMGVQRVQLKTDENNIRSRKAILKIGAQYEGTLRNDMIRDNGTTRNSAYYSILNSEWVQVKMQLKQLIFLKSHVRA